jgi:lipopolysaccharide transport system ATP-binding protein
MERIYQFRQEGRTILFVSHSLEAVRNLCTSAVWLDHGELKAAGSTTETIDAYLRQTNAQELERHQREQARREAEDQPAQSAPVGGLTNRWGSREVEIVRVQLLDGRGREPSVFQTGDTLTLRIHYEAHQPVTDPVFGIALHHASGFHINGPNTRFGGLSLGTVQGNGYVDYTIDELPLLAGDYVFTVAIYDASLTHPFDHHHMLYPFVVQTNAIAERWGSFYIPARWSSSGA